ncbi:hypothetical protein DCAR_0625239 [Daucus carota subsp. sativus]|uniref:Uncharacterized protein n=1 Tax=Daucus carota subsp. sativus TaxID=79200 RepID=A0AAF0XDB6_DAUCS|nr:PREDICTED: uncharacterized protein LOC108227085 [Daucus carota subsp. sativus]WOH05818.1 hypothetical protein DCAR_0625239 [Daucus carota subsp. sativus]
MCSFIKQSAPCVAAVAVVLTFVSLFCYIMSFLFFTCLLILSTNIFSTSSNKNRVVEETVENHEVVFHSEEDIEVKDKLKAGDEAVSTIMSLQNKQESLEEENAVHESLRSSDSYLESEELSSEGSSWSSQEFSDGSISDEESLIEIALPSGLYVSPKFKLQSFSAEAILFKQHGLMELLAEINEENLIEIDISMGIIKCSRFEIEA